MYDDMHHKPAEEWFNQAFGRYQGLCQQQALEIMDLLTQEVPAPFAEIRANVPIAPVTEPPVNQNARQELFEQITHSKPDTDVIDMTSSCLPP